MSLDRLARLREYRDLEARRTSPGLTPLEFHRWADLSAGVPKKPGQAAAAPKPTCLIAEFESFDALGRNWMSGLAGGGVFVVTPFVAEVGTEFLLAVMIKESGDRYEVPGVVASHNLGEGFSTRELGMGVRFRPRDAKHQARVDAMRAAAGAGAD